MKLKIPAILQIPQKLFVIFLNLANFRYFLAEGGRGSGKSQAIARIILYLCEKRKLKVICGREIQKSLEDSVFTIFVKLIEKYNLNFKINKNAIVHRKTGSKIVFKGFREQGRTNIKGLEAIDILWIDEAEAITAATLKVIIPTIRKPNSIIFFSMNRFVRDDAVYAFCLSRKKCLHVNINYFDNPYCPQELIDEAEECKQNNEKEYRHIWLGEPMEQASDYLFNAAKVAKMRSTQPFGDMFVKQRVIGFDFAAQGEDLSVATVLDRVSPVHWQVVHQEAWSEADPMVSTGKIVDIIGRFKPTASCIDVGGMGFVVYKRLQELNIRINPFNGAEQLNVPKEYGNTRAWGYYGLEEYIRNEWLIMDSPETEKELLKIRYKYKSNGERFIQSKEEMRKAGIASPDRADSLMMAVFCIQNYLGTNGNFGTAAVNSGVRVKRRNISKF